MLAEVAQAAQEVAKNGSSFTLAIPTSVATIALWKLAEFGIRAIKGRSKNGEQPRPGDGKTCEEHGEAIHELEGKVTTLQANDSNRERFWAEFRRENRAEHDKIFDLIREGQAKK